MGLFIGGFEWIIRGNRAISPPPLSAIFPKNKGGQIAPSQNSLYSKRENKPPPSWKKNSVSHEGGGALIRPAIFPIKKTKKVKKKVFFFQKNASKAVKNLYTKKWPKFFYNESDSKMVKKLCTKKWLKMFLA